MDNLNKYLIKQNKQMRKAISGYGEQSKKRKPINKSLRNQVWLKYMGNKAQGRCYCCKIRPIHFSDFQVGHNKAVAKCGKNHISNLRPICGVCNRGMRTKSIEQYKKMTYGEGRKTRKDKGTKKPKTTNNPYGAIKLPKFKQPKFDFGI